MLSCTGKRSHRHTILHVSFSNSFGLASARPTPQGLSGAPKYMPFVYDEANFLTNQKCFIVTGQCMAFLTAFFNSSLFKFCFRDSFPELQGGTRELSKIFFDKIPVLQVSDSINETFRHIVNKIQASYTKEQARNIDNMLFDLYNLTADERKVIGYVEIK